MYGIHVHLGCALQLVYHASINLLESESSQNTTENGCMYKWSASGRKRGLQIPKGARCLALRILVADRLHSSIDPRYA